MPKTRIWGDKHGPFVRTNGHIYRPQRSNTEYEHPNRVYETTRKVGDRIHISMVSQSPFCRIGKGNGELWGSHGMYIHPDGKLMTKEEQEENCWKPKL